MKTRLFLGLCLTCAFFTAWAATSEARVWTSTSGSILEGELVSSDGKNVTIKRAADSQEITFPLIKLSQADRDFLANMPAEGAGTDPASTAGKGGNEAKADDQLGEGWTEGVFGAYKVPYLLYEGASLDKAKKYPLVIYLHGREGVGLDNRSQLNDGVVETFINDSEYATRPCVVLAPQLRTGKHWTSAIGDTVLGLANTLIADHPIDARKIYLCGHSIGAVGALHLMHKQGSEGGFIAAVAASGGYADHQRHWHVHHVPVWLFHGDADTFLSVDDTRMLVEVYKKRGINVKYTEYPGEGNDIAMKVFSTPELHQWLFQQSR